MAPYIRTVKTFSGARAVLIVHSSRKGSWDIEHIGSARDDVELELLTTVARQRWPLVRTSWSWGWMRRRRLVALADHLGADGAPVGRALAGL